MKIYKEKDLLIILIWTMAILPFATIPILENNSLRIIIGIPIILFIPGYMLVATLFPGKNDLEMVGRLALSLGASVIIISLLGLSLNFTFGLEFSYMFATIFLYIVFLTYCTAYRRGKLPEEERLKFQILDKINPKNEKDSILIGILLFLCIITIGMSYITIVIPKTGEKFTEFYILDGSRKIDNYLTSLKVDNSASYIVGITNHEYEITNYRIDAVINQKILASRDIELNHGDTWEGGISFMPEEEGTDTKIEFLLYKNNLTDPYRKLYLTADVVK